MESLMNALGSEFVCRTCKEYFDSAANVPTSFPCGHSCCLKHTLTMVVCHVCGATVPDNLTVDLTLRDGAVELIQRRIRMLTEMRSIIQGGVAPSIPLIPLSPAVLSMKGPVSEDRVAKVVSAGLPTHPSALNRVEPHPVDIVTLGTKAEASGKKSGKKKKKRKSKKKASASSAFVPPASVDDISEEEGIAILFEHGVLTPQAMDYLKDDCVFRSRFRIESLPLFTAGKHDNFWSLAIDALTGWLFFAEIVGIDECEEGSDLTLRDEVGCLCRFDVYDLDCSVGDVLCVWSPFQERSDDGVHQWVLQALDNDYDYEMCEALDLSLQETRQMCELARSAAQDNFCWGCSGRGDRYLYRCKSCFRAQYCSDGCQVRHSAAHRRYCTALQAIDKMVTFASLDDGDDDEEVIPPEAVALVSRLIESGMLI